LKAKRTLKRTPKMKGEIRIKKSKSDKEQPLIYYIRNGEQKSRTNIGIKIHPKYWKNNNVTDNHPDYTRLDYVLSQKNALLKRALYEAQINDWTVSMVGKYLANNGNINDDVDFFEYLDELCTKLTNQGKFGTAKFYKANSSLLRNTYMLGKPLMMSSITNEFMREYVSWLVKRGYTSNTVHNYSRVVRTVYNRSVEDGVFVPGANHKYPFVKVIPSNKSRGTKDLTEQQLQDLINYEPKKPRKHFRDAKNYWLLSFYLRGIDFVDLSMIKKTDVFRGRILLHRHKGLAKDTGIELSIRIFPRAQQIIDYYNTPERSESKYLLPINDKYGAFDESEKSAYQYKKYRELINAELVKIRRDLDFDVRLSTKVTRHTFATLARYKRVDFEIIQQMLGHSRGSVTDTYLAKFSDEEIDQAHALIIGEDLPSK